MSAIRQAFQKAKANNKAAFIPYVTGGYPDEKTCIQLIKALDEAGADIIEIGVPFSDPVADGPIIQEASKLALDGGVTPKGMLKMVASLYGSVSAPLVLMTYYNPILAMGLEDFATEAAKAGVAGVIVPDLPPEEAEPWIKVAQEKSLDTIFLVTPGTSQERQKAVVKVCSGFLYYVSMYGVTGGKLDLSADRLASIQQARKAAGDLPVAVGFGVSSPEQAAALADVADGVIVGSALVKRMVQADNAESGLKAASGLAHELAASLAA
jgi:tryptophan synthase alpha chain